MKAFYITLNEKREKRLLENVCEPLNLECIKFPGVKLKEKNTGVCEGQNVQKIGNAKVARVQGLNAAHRNVWEHVQNLDEERVLVFEDDVVFPFKNKEPALKKFNEYLGGLDDSVDLAYLGNLKHKLGAHAYAITPDAAKKLFDMGPNCNGIIDGNIKWKCSKEKNFTCAYPPHLGHEYPVRSVLGGVGRQTGLIYQGKAI